MITDSQGLLREGLKLAERTWARAQRELGWRPEALDLLAIHQVSRVHTERYAELLGVPIEKIYKLYEEHGNIGPAAVPTALFKAAEEGRVGRGARVGLMGIGSGLNCAMYEVIW
jgi:3-oxoacyl-[acyl-carrier-protein] synthase-3